MSKITIVTGFFNIKRDNWQGFERSSEKYVQYFSMWARIKNDLIVYVDSSEIAGRVMNIRESYGLLDRTKVVVIEDIWSIDSILYNSIKLATNNDTQIKFRLRAKNPESWNADYNYVMLLKEWTVVNAVDKFSINGTVAWLDFGFNHGGALFTNDEEFSFEWSHDFEDKIYLFNIKDLDSRPIFDIIRSMDTYIMGPIIIAPAKLWAKLWEMVRYNMICLNNTGLVDDDQSILLMSYRSNPNLFKVVKSNWFLPLKEFGGSHLTCKPSMKKKKLISRIGRYIKKTLRNITYSFKQFLEMQKTDL